MNMVMLQGRLTASPESKTLGSGKNLTEFSIAVRRPGKDDVADFFRCTAWDATAEFVTNYFGKGDGIIVQGQLRQERWEDESGQKREAVRVTVREVYFPQGNKTGGGVEHTTEPASEAGGISARDAVAAARSADAKTDELLNAIAQLPE